MHSKIRLAVFDIAGTTIKDKNNVAKAFQESFLKHGFEGVTLEEANQKMGYPKPLAIREILANTTSDTAYSQDEKIEEIHGAFVENMIAYYEASSGIAPMDDAETVFKKLQEMGIKIGLDTGFSRDITDVILKRVGWKNSPLIDVVVCSDEVKRGRPYPDMIHQMMEKFGIKDPMEVVKIGDTEVDINQGLNTGCLMSIAVTTGAFTQDELLKHHPTHIVDSLTEALDLIRSKISTER